MKRKSKVFVWILLIAAVIMAMPSADLFAATGISMSQKSATVNKGESITLKVMKGDKAVSGAVWGSSDSSVATVNSKGQVTGKKKGSAVISAMYDGSVVECVVSVVNKTSDSIVRYNVLMLDCSGSMKGSPMKLAKEAASRFAETVMNADGTNYVAVIAFGNDSEIACGFTTDLKKVKKAISGLEITENTNINAAFDDAEALLNSVKESGSNVIKNVILCSDGLPRTGDKLEKGEYTKKDHKYYQYANAVVKVDKALKKKDYFIYALGFFHNSKGDSLLFGKQFMKDLASEDKCYIIEKTKDLNAAFESIAQQITSLTLSEQPVVVEKGASKTLKVYKNGVATTGKWSTSKSSVAKITENGVITGVEIGSTVVTVNVNGTMLKSKVEVVAPATTIKLDKSSISLTDKKPSQTLKATVTGEVKDVSWTSSKKSIATVDANGKVTAKKTGKCTITATCNGVSASCSVNVKVADDITDDFVLYKNAAREADGGIVLTECSTWKSGSAWYSDPISTKKGLTIMFEYWAGGGRNNYYGGADGIVLNLAEKTGIGADGGGLGFSGYYGVEFDSYPKNSGDPGKKHIAIVSQSISRHLAYVADDRVDDSEWHKVKIVYKNDTLTVYLDSEKVLSQSDITLKDEVYLGLSASTGSGYNKHMFRNFKYSTK